jgi:hypothetical protein
MGALCRLGLAVPAAPWKMLQLLWSARCLVYESLVILAMAICKDAQALTCIRHMGGHSVARMQSTSKPVAECGRSSAASRSPGYASMARVSSAVVHAPRTHLSHTHHRMMKLISVSPSAVDTVCDPAGPKQMLEDSQVCTLWICSKLRIS